MNDECAACDHHSDDACAACDHQSDEQRQLADRLLLIHHKIVVLSGKGGVGKSTVAVNLAVALAEEGMRVGLLDIDLHGPSIPRMLRLESSQVVVRDGYILPIPYTANLEVMSIGFLLGSESQAIIWRGPRKYSMIRQFLADVEWGELDYLVVDAPPGTGDEPLAVLELLGSVDGAVIVTTPQRISVTDVRKSVSFCEELRCPVLGILENMSGSACPHCGGALEMFGSGGGEALAAEAAVPFLGAVPFDPDVVKSGDTGDPFVARRTTVTAGAFRDAVKPLLDMATEAEESRR